MHIDKLFALIHVAKYKGKKTCGTLVIIVVQCPQQI